MKRTGLAGKIASIGELETGQKRGVSPEDPALKPEAGQLLQSPESLRFILQSLQTIPSAIDPGTHQRPTPNAMGTKLCSNQTRLPTSHPPILGRKSAGRKITCSARGLKYKLTMTGSCRLNGTLSSGGFKDCGCKAGCVIRNPFTRSLPKNPVMGRSRIASTVTTKGWHRTRQGATASACTRISPCQFLIKS